MRNILLLLFLLVVVMFPAPLPAAILVLKATPQVSNPSLTIEENMVGRAEQGDVISVRPDDWTLTDARFGIKECWRNPLRQFR